VDQNNTSKDKATTPYDKQDTTTASEVDQDITRRSVDQLAEEAPPQVQVNGMGQLAVEEIIQTGAVPWKVYKQYAALMGWPVLLLLLVCLLTCQACNILSQWWLAMWASAPPSQQHQPMWCGVLAALVVGVMLAAQLGSSVHYEWTLRAASSLYNAMLRGLLYAPLSVFHTNPAGRILNRFSSDLVSIWQQYCFEAASAVRYKCAGATVLGKSWPSNQLEAIAS
jgi:ATP-binding cassette subfamily C (CFTR/MRP) protein 4